MSNSFRKLPAAQQIAAPDRASGRKLTNAAFHFPSLAGSRMTLVALANRERHDFGLQLVFKMVRTLERFADA